jgi:hypothetical protein
VKKALSCTVCGKRGRACCADCERLRLLAKQAKLTAAFHAAEFTESPTGRMSWKEFDEACSKLGNLADHKAVRTIRFEACLARYAEEDAKRMLLAVAKVIPLVANDPMGEINRLIALFEPIKEVLK